MNKTEFLTKLVFSNNTFINKMTCKELRDFADSIFGSEKSEQVNIKQIEPYIIEEKYLYIPLLERTIAVDYIKNEEKYTWKQAMDYCKEYGLELPSKDDAIILLWQFDKINALLHSLGKPEISKESWFWTKTEHSATLAWYWNSDSWGSNYGKNNINAVVPFFAKEVWAIHVCFSTMEKRLLMGTGRS